MCTPTVRWKAKPGQLTKGHYETFLQQKLLVPLKVSGDVDRVARWTDRFGRHLNKRVTMSTLFSLAQLHPVEPDVPQWNYIADALLGKVLYTQARLRGTEIPQWWQDHGLAHNGGADGIARSLDREHFRQTFQAAWFQLTCPHAVGSPFVLMQFLPFHPFT